MTVRLATQRYWLVAVNLAVVVFVGLPVLAPVLMAAGNVEAANAIYSAYHLVCHQWAFRSFFLFGPQVEYGQALGSLVGADAMYHTVGSPELGYKVAFCERDVAIYLAVLAAGIAYGRLRDRLPELGLTGYGLLILPMAIDGFTQLFGWRESTVELRTATGVLFGVASVWLIYPRIDALVARDLGQRSSVAPTGASAA
jgi:uncharacterized membrane protein